MWTAPALLLLFAPTLPLLHAQHPGRAMQPFGSDAELLQYLAMIDRARLPDGALNERHQVE